MNKKYAAYFFASVISALIIFSFLFILILNNEIENNSKKILINNNNLITSVLQSQIKMNELTFINKLKVNYFIVDSNNKIVSSSTSFNNEITSNIDYKYLINQIDNNHGELFYSINKHTYIFYESKIQDNDRLITFIPIDSKDIFLHSYLNYYLFVLLITLFLSYLIFNRFYQDAIKPWEYLAYITFRIARGEVELRAKTSGNISAEKISNNINKIAAMLQDTMKENNYRQKRLEAILKSMDSGVIAIDNNRKIIMVNPYAEKIFGIKKNIIGQNLLDIVRSYELENALQPEKNSYSDIKIQWPKERDLRIKTTDIIDRNEIIGTVAVVQDITDIKEFENMRSQFVANVSHELKTPLTSIIGFSETLKEVTDRSTVNKFLDIINEEAQRLKRLIDDILTLSKIENKIEVNNDKININKAIDNVINIMRNIAVSKKINLISKCETVPDIYGDLDEFKQMLINLIDNAIKYSDDGSNVIVGTLKLENSIQLWVEDTGYGIPEQNIDRLFERFYRVEKARSRKKGGTGLGLAIVKHIVVNLNGNITVESKVGKGSKFTIVIPLK